MKSRNHIRIFRAMAALFLASLLAIGAMMIGAMAEGETNDYLYLSDIEWKSWKMYQSSSDNPNSPYKPSINCNEQGGPLTIAGQVYDKGLRTHPDTDYPAEFVYDISMYDYTTFSATVGKDSLGGEGLVQFFVLADGEIVGQSPAVNYGMSYELKCDITGCRELTLRVTDGGDKVAHDSAGWGNVMLSYATVEKETEDPLPEGDYTYLSDIDWQSWTMYQSSSDDPESPYSPSVNCNEVGDPLVIGIKTYQKGLRTHPDLNVPAEFVYDISGYEYNAFSVTVGKDSRGKLGKVQFFVLADGEIVGESPVMNYGDTYKMVCSIGGCSTLTLRVTDGGDGCNDDSVGWGNPIMYTDPDLPNQPTTPPDETDPEETDPNPPEVEQGEEVYLSDINWTSWKMYESSSSNPNSPYRPSLDKNEQGGPLTIAGQVFKKGLRTHPDKNYAAEFVYDISAYTYTTFSATVGKDSLGGAGLVKFYVLADGVIVGQSPTLVFGDSYDLICDITGCKKLTLRVTDGGDGVDYDSAAWGNAKLSFAELSAPEIAQPSPDGEHVFLSDLEWQSWTMKGASSTEENPACRPGINVDDRGNLPVIGGMAYEHALSTYPSKNAPADIVYDISAYDYTTFSASVGKNSCGGQGLVRFVVLADDVVVADSLSILWGETYEIICDITGCQKLTLRVMQGGDGDAYDAATWGNPMLSYGLLDEPPAETDPTETDPTETDPTETDPTETDPTETDPTETDPTETDPTETDPTETDPTETDPTETDPTETDPTETDPTETDPETDPATEPVDTDKGCGSALASSVAVVVVAGAAGAVALSHKKKKEDCI